MNAPEPTHYPRSAYAGMSLVELLVSMAVATLLIALLATVVASATTGTTRILDRLDAQQTTAAALEYLERDFMALAQTEVGRTSLTMYPETVVGSSTGALEIGSYWIMLLSRPLTADTQGALRVISYRLVFTDPMVPGMANPRLCLYRSVVAPSSAGDGFLTGADLRSDFWSSHWDDYIDGSSTLLEDYMDQDIVEVGVDVTVTFQAPPAGGATGAPVSVTKRFPISRTVGLNWTREGLVGEDDQGGALPFPNTPTAITLSLTSLRSEGAKLYRIGAISLSDARKEYGVTYQRTIPFPSQQ